MSIDTPAIDNISSYDVVLRDGRSLRVRPIRPDDTDRLRDMFYRLTPLTRYFRFHFEKTDISDQELEAFTEANCPERCAIVGTVGEGKDEEIVALGTYDTVPDGKTAEISFLVQDNIQVSGVGSLLLERLATEAGRYRIKRFVGAVLPENTRMLELFNDSGFRLSRQLEDGVWMIYIDLEEQEEYAKRQAQREHIARSAGVRRILYPQSVAVIGASRQKESVGGALFRNLLNSSFNGPVFPINPTAVSIAGVLAYPTVLDVPSDIDLAVIVVPAERVLDVVDQCGQKAVPAIIIISVGFGEAGAEGKERERLLKQKTLAYGMRVVGPNCLGVLNSEPNVQLDATFSPVRPRAGNLSIGSQSGALGLAVLDYAKSIDLGVAHFVSIGNRIDISSNDLLEFWEDDPNTDVVLLYLESFGNGRKFSRIARRISKRKPIVAVKAGRSEVGARAASSHTGALASTEIATSTMFKSAGVIQVNTIKEMFDVSEALVSQPAPKGPRVGILTNAGGPGVLAADACIGWGLKVPTLSKKTQEKLRQFLPPEAAVANPVDMIASAEPEAYKAGLKVMLEDTDIDAILLIYIPPLVTRPEDVARNIREAMADYQGEKPVLANFMMSEGATVDLRLDEKRYIPSYVFPESAVQALALAYQHSQYQQEPVGTVPKFTDIDKEAARQKLFGAAKITKKGVWLTPETGTDLLRSYGIRVVETRVAMTAEEAAKAAEEVGFPVVMKVRSSSILHKTDVGGIVLGLTTKDQVKRAFRNMAKKLETAGLKKGMEGVIIQPVVGDAQEVIVGMSQDPIFGPLIVIGMGGVQVELQKDLAFALSPVTDVGADKMLKSLRGLPLLTGWRGSTPKDTNALKDVLLRFSTMVEDLPEIDQMEVNPLMVLDKGKGCVAVDARIFLKEPTY